jgi:hypothetical protein
MRRMWASYERALVRHPLLVKSLSAAVLMGAGDLVAQHIASRSVATTLEEDPPMEVADEAWDWGRVGRMMSWGLVGAGPGLHLWYGMLDRAIPATSLQACLAKLVLDQSLAAPGFIAAFFVYAGAAEGRSMQQIREKLAADYWNTMKVNWSVWPIASFINFRFVPPVHRVLYASCVSLCWYGTLWHLVNCTFVYAKGDRPG